jgi:hypothetical protein
MYKHFIFILFLGASHLLAQDYIMSIEQMLERFPKDGRKFNCVDSEFTFHSGKTLTVKQVSEFGFVIKDKETDEEYSIGESRYVQSISLNPEKSVAVLNIPRGRRSTLGHHLLIIVDDRNGIPLEDTIFETLNRSILLETQDLLVGVINVGDVSNFPIVDLYVDERFKTDGVKVKGQDWYKGFRTWKRWKIVEQQQIGTMDEASIQKYKDRDMQLMMLEGVRVFDATHFSNVR